MGNLLAKLFIKNYQDYSDPKVRIAYGKLSGIVGICTNLFLTLIKLVTGFLIGSIAIMADGINNFSDAGSSIITLIGFKASSMPADKHHPFGHQRIEYITGLMVSFVILFIGISLMRSSIEKIITPEEVEKNFFVIIILGVSILIKLWQYLFYRKSGKLIHSSTLTAASRDSLNDSLSTVAVLISFAVYLITGWKLDGYMGLLVSLFIIVGGISLIKSTMSPLIGEAPSQEYIAMLSQDLLSYPGVIGIHDMVIHSYGPGKTFMTVHAEVDSAADFVESHDIIDNIEHDFLSKYDINLVIHMDPVETRCEQTLELKQRISEILYNIDPILGFHDFRVVKGPTHTNVIFDVVMPIKYKMTAQELAEMIKDEVKKNDRKLIAVITVDKAYMGEDEVEKKHEAKFR